MTKKKKKLRLNPISDQECKDSILKRMWYWYIRYRLKIYKLSSKVILEIVFSDLIVLMIFFFGNNLNLMRSIPLTGSSCH